MSIFRISTKFTTFYTFISFSSTLSAELFPPLRREVHPSLLRERMEGGGDYPDQGRGYGFENETEDKGQGVSGS